MVIDSRLDEPAGMSAASPVPSRIQPRSASSEESPADPARRLIVADPSESLRTGAGALSQTRRTSRAERLAHLDTMFSHQVSVVRRSQLEACGWRRHHVEHEIDYGRWQLVAPEVVVMHNGPLTYDQRLWVGVLHAGPTAVLSHATTLEINGLEQWEPPLIDVLSTKSNTVERLDGYCFHETRRDYVPWIHPTRRPRQLRIEEACLLAAERRRSLRASIGLIAACVQQRLAAADRLFTSSLTISKLRHGHQIRLALLDIGGGAHSFGEIDLGRICRQFGLQTPTRQRFRLDRSGRRRFLDCEWELADGTTVVLEIDGAFHREAENWWRDMKRERGVVIDVGRVLRCSTTEMRLEPAYIAADLRAVGVPTRP